ncbi:MAG TPA: DMT family transporter [Actinomycetota bacterium]|nr:DMT family transporter [Actinomycetota bacterium]
MRRRIDPGILLLLTPLLWGVTFPGAKLALDHLPPFAFMAWTRGLGFLAIVAMVPLLRGAAGPADRPFRAVIGPGLLLGALIFVAYVLQTEGLARTTATNAGFITGLYVVFTPILASVLFRHHVPGAAWIAVGVSVVGLALLSVQDLGAIRVHLGDALVLAGAVAWAGHVVGVGYFSPRFPSWVLSLAQMGATAAFQLIAVAGVGLRWREAASLDVWPLLILTGVFGSGVAYTLQVMAQQTVTPARAVVLLAGESLFAALFAAIWIGERLTLTQWAGALLVLAAMGYSELAARRPPEQRLEPAAAP